MTGRVLTHILSFSFRCVKHFSSLFDSSLQSNLSDSSPQYRQDNCRLSSRGCGGRQSGGSGCRGNTDSCRSTAGVLSKIPNKVWA